MCEDCALSAIYSPEESRQDAIKRYYMCMMNVQNKTAQQAFMSACALYSSVHPETPDWRVPKDVAMILNPGLRI